eukprot:COSAG05_NODE_19208_length_296_cov_0.781726_1_plen_33_part_01
MTLFPPLRVEAVVAVAAAFAAVRVDLLSPPLSL